MNYKKISSRQRSQGALEYLIIIAAVLIVAAVTTVLITGVVGEQRENVLIEECRSAAAQCSIEQTRYEDPACEFCVKACETLEENDLMENAVDCCKAGMEEEIYRGSDGKACLEELMLTLDINIEGEGTTNPGEGTHFYEENEEVTITADPDEGQMFEKWTGDKTGTEETITITMDENKEITAHFKEEHDLTINTEGEGTTNPSSGTHTYIEGTTVDIDPNPEEGYELVKWTGDCTGTTCTVTMDEDKEVTAHFEKGEFDLTINIKGKGSTDPGEGTYTYEGLETVEIEATSEEDWYFEEWTGDYESEEEEIEITIGKDMTITANFDWKGEIYNWHDLDKVRNHLNNEISLETNLDENTDGYNDYNTGDGWEPIGDSDNEFTGSFDGQEYEIADLYINRPDEDDIGLFGRTDGSTIEDVGVVDVDITGESRTGGLAGRNSGIIINSYVKGSITGEFSRNRSTVGGLVGFNINGDIYDSYVSGDVTGTGEKDNYYRTGGLVGTNAYSGDLVEGSYFTGTVKGIGQVGGLVGSNDGIISGSHSAGEVIEEHGSWARRRVGGLVGNQWGDGSISDSYSSADVTGGDWKVGGLVGVTSSDISSSFATGDVTGEGSRVGGLLGHGYQASVTDSYATGDVEGDSSVGGLIGTISGSRAEITNSYSIGSVTGDSLVGGLIGNRHLASVYRSYWNTETSGQDDSDRGSPRDTSEMTYEYDDGTYVGWDFNDVWLDGHHGLVEGEDYPALQWQE